MWRVAWAPYERSSLNLKRSSYVKVSTGGHPHMGYHANHPSHQRLLPHLHLLTTSLRRPVDRLDQGDGAAALGAVYRR